MCVWAVLPTRTSSGLRAYQGVYVHIQGLPFERTTRAASPEPRPGAPTRAQQKGQDLTDAYMSTQLRSGRCEREQFTLLGAPKTQTTSPETVLFHHFSPRWSAFWALEPSDCLRGGGIALHEGATRRRHAVRGPRVVQNPHIGPGVGHQGTAAECDTNSQCLGPTVSIRRLGTTAGLKATLSTARTPKGSTGGATVGCPAGQHGNTHGPFTRDLHIVLSPTKVLLLSTTSRRMP